MKIDTVQDLIDVLQQGQPVSGADPAMLQQAVQALADTVARGELPVQSARFACKALNPQSAFALTRQLARN